MADYSSLPTIRDQLFNKSLSISNLLEHYLKKTEEYKDLNAFIEIFEKDAIDHARVIQQKIDNGTPGKLAGMILGLKDNICYKDHISSASSKSLYNYTSVYHSTVVQRLLDEDAIIIGRTSCDEFAMGGTNETSVYGPVLNPIDRRKVPGGSSGGSAVAVATGMCLAALGSDTGGSVRQPASFCGVIGMKPSYGRVSRYGLIAYGSSFDQIGPITRTIEDAAIILEVISGGDKFDTTASSKVVPSYSDMLRQAISPAKIAYLQDPLEHKALDTEIKDKMYEIISRLKDKGHMVDPVDFPLLDYLVPAYYVMAMAEASSNLARYDGIHYGHRSQDADDIRSTYIRSRSEGFGLEAKRRIMTGTFVLSTGYYDAYYAKAQKVRRMIADKTKDIFSKYDFILLPTTPRTAFDLGSMGDDPVALYLEDIFTIHANLAGIPALSLPLGHHSNGLPFGIQVMAEGFQEGELMRFGDYLLKEFKPVEKKHI